MATSFNAMAEELSRNKELQHNMIADIAHELRTPISNIRGYLEAVEDGLVKPDAMTIGSLAEETALLSRLIEDLQELSLVEIGELSLTLEPATIESIVEHAIETFQPQAIEKGVALEGKVERELPPINIDRHRMIQVLSNLIRNALAHTGQGDEVTVSATRSGDNIEIKVEDTGEGIPAADLPHIFERFYRVDKSRNRSTGGSGLGLTIAKRLIEAQGGSIQVTSIPTEGTAFLLTIPVTK